MLVILHVDEEFLELECAEAGLSMPRRALTSERVDAARALSRGYEAVLARRAARSGEPLSLQLDGERIELLALGGKLHNWLDGEEGWLASLLPRITAPLLFEVRGRAQPGKKAAVVLGMPWEALVAGGDFLAAQELLRFAPFRRLGSPGQPSPLDDFRLAVGFMASSPRGGGNELDFEAEELAILSAAGSNHDIDLIVDDSGDPEQLGKRIGAMADKLPVLHLSCHGVIAGPVGASAPMLLMEDEKGDPRPTTAAALVGHLHPFIPQLQFVSACLTAAGPDVAPGASAAHQSIAHSLTSALVVAGYPAALGWGGSVADAAATRFAAELYDSLSKGAATPEAVATARDALFRAKDDAEPAADQLKDADRLRRSLGAAGAVCRRDWHLPRLWVGPGGGGPVVRAGAHRKRSLLPSDHAQKLLLAQKGKEKLEVANPAMFVGRRRETQTALAALADNKRSGILLHGMGRQGKSSLAARLSNRLPQMPLAVVFGSYDARSILDAIAGALKGNATAQAILQRGAKAIRDDESSLEGILIELLGGPCKQSSDGNSFLLLIDDLERALEADPGGGRHRVVPQARAALAAVLRAFDPARSDSRLVMTSRFPFALMQDDREGDLAERLELIALAPFHEAARSKLSARQLENALESFPRKQDLEERLVLLARAQECARGNPGLQDLLGRKIALNRKVPVTNAEDVLGQVERYLNRGDAPQDEQARAFLERLAVDQLLHLAGEEGGRLLRAMTVFHVPTPASVVDALAAKFGATRRRLEDLGLLDPSPDLVNPSAQAYSINRLAAGRLEAPDDADEVAKAAVPTLFAAWGGSEGDAARPFAADIELLRLAMLAASAEVVQACAPSAVLGLERSHRVGEAASVGGEAIALLESEGLGVPVGLRARVASCLQTIGKGAEADAQLETAAAGLSARPGDKAGTEVFLHELGNRQMRAGRLEQAFATFTKLAEFVSDRPREYAIAKGQIADILEARGLVDEALRIRRDEELPVYERFGDVRSVAVTNVQIAGILQDRGQVDEALRILREQLPVYERLGELRSVAVTKVQIADIHQARGQVDEALRILREQLPVYERLGDVRELAVTKGRIADIHQARGQLDEALRIRREEELPVYERLGDVRSVAVTKGQIADILEARGQKDEALRTRLEEELPVYERLGDVRSVAATKVQIADMLAARGQVDEALRILREQLSVYERLGEVRSVAVMKGRIANALASSGDLVGATALLEERLVMNRGLGDADGVAATLWDLACIDLQVERINEARPRIAEAFAIVSEIGRAAGIAAIGPMHAQFLATAGRGVEALETLARSRNAAKMLGHEELIGRIDEVERHISSGAASRADRSPGEGPFLDFHIRSTDPDRAAEALVAAITGEPAPRPSADLVAQNPGAELKRALMRVPAELFLAQHRADALDSAERVVAAARSIVAGGARVDVSVLGAAETALGDLRPEALMGLAARALASATSIELDAAVRKPGSPQ